jgi:hypothetical protein
MLAGNWTDAVKIVRALLSACFDNPRRSAFVQGRSEDGNRGQNSGCPAPAKKGPASLY